MKYMSFEQLRKYRLKHSREYEHDLERYFQPIKDIIVITEGEGGEEIQWLLNGETSHRPTNYGKPVVIPYRLVKTKKNKISGADIFDTTTLLKFWRKHRICEEHLLAFVCSHLYHQGWNHWNVIEEINAQFDKLQELNK